MRILLTTPYSIWPATFGGAVRTLQLARGLSALGHRVTLLSAEPAGPHTAIGENACWLDYPAKGQRGHFWNRGFIAAYRDTLTQGFDLIVAGFPYQSFMITGLAQRAGIAVVYDAHNVEYDRFRRMGSITKAGIVRLAESHMTRNANAILTVSTDDAALMSEIYRKPSLVLPNGVDLTRFTPGQRSDTLLARYGLRGKRIILFFGPLDYPPNLDALRFLVDQVWPGIHRAHSDACLLIVGRQPPDWASDRVNVITTGTVDDIVAHIRLAELVVSPISTGGGTRLKIIEALACGKRVISTPFAATGIASKNGEGLLLAPLQEFQSTIMETLDSEMDAEHNETSTSKLVQHFDWRRIIAAIDWPALANSPG